jgi:hypothetical protein
MKVFYRMTPRHSIHEEKRPRHAFNKIALARMCLISFVEGFSDIKPKIHFLLDACDQEWDDMIKELVPFEYEIEHLNFGSLFTSGLLQYDRARGLDEPILFQEDDYVYLKGSGKKIDDAIRELEFVAPYDHREFYTVNQTFHKGPFDIKLIGEQHWRTIDFNTMTWGCHSGRIDNYWDPLHRKGFWDKDTWDQMAIEGAKLWSPIPSLCTHMHADFLAPGIDWEKRFNEVDK